MFRRAHIQNLNSSLQEDDPLENAPLLKRIGNKNPFTLPEGYFDALPLQIMSRCNENTLPKPLVNNNKIFLLFSPRYIFLLFAAIIGIALFLNRQNNNAIYQYQSTVAAIPDSTLIANLQSDIAYVDVGDLENMLADRNNPVFEELPEPPVADSSNGQIINYLINNNVDASDIESNL